MDCIHIPSIGYQDFGRRIFTKSSETRIPVSGSIDITSRCNLKCIHCYIQGTYTEKDLTYPEICKIIDQIADAGCMWLLVTGGEPLSRPDFMDIYRYIKSKGIMMTLFTNGTLITPEIADLLVEYRPFAVEVSVYGITESTYEKVTGIPGSFERFKRGVELLKNRNVYFRLKSVIINKNRHELQAMKQYAKDLNVPYRYDCMINPKLDGSSEPTEYRLSPDEIVAIECADEERFNATKNFYHRYGNLPENDYIYVCGAGINSFHIDSTGRLSVCLVSREPGYDLRKGTFFEGFYKEFPKVRDKKRTRYSECQDCSLKGVCDQCPAWGQLEHGDPEAKVDFLCQVAHLRVDNIRKYQLIQAEAKSR